LKYRGEGEGYGPHKQSQWGKRVGRKDQVKERVLSLKSKPTRVPSYTFCERGGVLVKDAIRKHEGNRDSSPRGDRRKKVPKGNREEERESFAERSRRGNKGRDRVTRRRIGPLQAEVSHIKAT